MNLSKSDIQKICDESPVTVHFSEGKAYSSDKAEISLYPESGKWVVEYKFAASYDPTKRQYATKTSAIAQFIRLLKGATPFN